MGQFTLTLIATCFTLAAATAMDDLMRDLETVIPNHLGSNLDIALALNEVAEEVSYGHHPSSAYVNQVILATFQDLKIRDKTVLQSIDDLAPNKQLMEKKFESECEMIVLQPCKSVRGVLDRPVYGNQYAELVSNYYWWMSTTYSHQTKVTAMNLRFCYDIAGLDLVCKKAAKWYILWVYRGS